MKRPKKYKNLSLREDQARILPVLLQHDFYMLLWPMRLGKSLPPLIVSDVRKSDVLVITTAKGVVGWEKCKSMCGWDINIKIISTGKIKQKSFDPDALGFYYETIILDEIQQYRSNSNQFKAAKKLRQKAKYCYGLTGTIIDKDFAEIFYPQLLLDKGELFGTSRGDFLAAFCRRVRPYSKKDFSFEIIPDYLEPVKESVFKTADRVQNRDMLAPTKHIAYYSLTKEQESFLVDLTRRKSLGLPAIDSENVLLEAAGKQNKIAQVLSGFYIREDKSIYSLKEAKRACLYAVLCELLFETEKKIVIWYRYREEIQLITRAVQSLSESGLDIETELFIYSNKNMELFRQHDGSAIIVANPRSAGAGVDFSFVDLAIYYSESWSGIDSAQSEARMGVYKGTQRKKIYYLLAKEPIAEQFHKLIDKKVCNILDVLE